MPEITDPTLIALLEQPQTKINELEGAGVGPADLDAVRRDALDKIKLGRSLIARSRDGFFTTGFGSGVARSFGATGAYDVAQDTETLKNAGALMRIMEMSAANGGKNPLTPLSNADFKALGESIANLDTSQSDAQYQANVQRMLEIYTRAYEAAGGKDLETELSGGAPGGQPPIAGADEPPEAGGAPVEVSKTGEMRFSTEQDKAFAAQAQAMFDQGATREQLNQLAVQQGYMPYGPDLDKAIDYRNRGGKGARIAAPESGYKGPSTLGALAATPVGSFVASAGNAITGGLMDEIVGMTGGDQEQAQAAKEVMRDANPLSSLAGEVAGAGLAMTGVGRIPGVAAKVPMLAREMAYGAAYGAGESNDDRLGGAAVGAGAAFVGDRAVKAVRGVARRYASRAASAEQAGGRAAAEAGQRQGIDVMPADVGGPFVRRLTGAAAQGPVSAMPVIRRAQQITAQAQEARDRIAAEIGEALEPEAAGQAARRGAKAFIGRTAARARTLYNQAEAMAKGVEVPLTKAVATLDQHVAELEGIPGGAEGLGALKALREEMEGNFTVQGIRGMRTQLRDRFISTGLRGSDLERRVNQVIDAATDDIADGLQAQGMADAASAYRAADRYWRARVRTIDKALEPIIGTGGEKSGEEIMGALNRAAKGNAARLASFVRALPGEEQSILRATYISQLGRAAAGAQDAAGEAFSLPQFLTHWNQMTPGAKKVLFTGESRAALDDLARVAAGTKQSQRYQNFSNTAGGIVGQGVLTGAGFMAGGPLGVIGSAMAQYGSGMLLASPKFARWLARAPKEGHLSREYIDKLQRIAATEAPIAAEVSGLRQALLGAANDNAVTAAAASPETEANQQDQAR